MKRQPESTTEDLEDAGDQENRGDADDDDMKALGAVNEEPVITIGVNGETLDDGESVEESYVDDVNGGFLDPDMVSEARVEELAGYLKMQVYCRVPVAEIGSHKVIKTRWVDTNKGDERSPEIRCRLVAKEVKKRNNTEEESANFFASTPPLEAVKFLISEAMTKRVSRNNRPLKLSFIDVKKAHLCSDVLRELYVEPPPEANDPPDIVWRLQRAMYGTRDAAAAWEREWTKTLNPVGFKSGVSNPTLLHCETLRAAYLSQDRPDLSCSTKELARDMQKPTEQSMTNLKRLGRYLKKRPRLVQLFVEQTSTTNVVRLDVYGDSDHAGCLKTRKSTTGMALMRDAHCLKVSSHTQTTISLSSGESEYYGIVKCAAIGLGARSMLAYFDMCVDVVVRTDSSSGLAVGSRRGLGRLRHVQTRYLWVQQRVQQGDFRLKKEPGDTNVSDALTKPLDEKRMTNLLTMMGYVFRGGRTSLTPESA